MGFNAGFIFRSFNLFSVTPSKKGEVPHLTLVQNSMFINSRRFKKSLVIMRDTFGDLTS
jgi:hypothetical protein